MPQYPKLDNQPLPELLLCKSFAVLLLLLNSLLKRYWYHSIGPALLSLQSCEHLFLCIQCLHTVALGTGCFSVSVGLKNTSKGNFRSCLPFPRGQTMSLIFLPLDAQHGLHCTANAV